VFSIIVAVAFQSDFKMHLNNIFFIFKNLFFDINTSKQSKNIKKKSQFLKPCLSKNINTKLLQHLYFHYLLVHHVTNIFHLFHY
jgi:hypothetical protein